MASIRTTSVLLLSGRGPIVQCGTAGWSVNPWAGKGACSLPSRAGVSRRTGGTVTCHLLSVSPPPRVRSPPPSFCLLQEREESGITANGRDISEMGLCQRRMKERGREGPPWGHVSLGEGPDLPPAAAVLRAALRRASGRPAALALQHPPTHTQVTRAQVPSGGKAHPGGTHIPRKVKGAWRIPPEGLVF